jgi:Subtilase family/FG-GAP-like repeat
LRNAGVATVIAAGNDFSTDGINSPACISTAVAVGSSDKNNKISNFTNISSQVALMAPGGFGGTNPCQLGAANADILSSVSVTSSAIVNQWNCFFGTSMAAPHVAGAFAAIRTMCPNATVDRILAALQKTGVPIKDTRSGGTVTKNSIRVDLALKSMGCARHDFNADGTSDILWRNTNGDTAIWLMSAIPSGGALVLSVSQFGIIDNSWQIVGQRDFNGDGNADLLWSNTNGDTSIWLMTSVMTPNGPQLQVLSTNDLGFVGNGWSIVGTGDFNGDGFGDILWRNANGDTSIWLMTGNGTQVQVLSTNDLGLVPTSWSVAQTGDFNGDGTADILWHNMNGDTSIWLMTGTATQVQVSSVTDFGLVPTSWNIAGTGDFNGDGYTDILWHNTNGNTSIWLMTASGTQVQVSSTTDLGFVPTSWSVAVTGDFNGDGTSDILWRNTNGDTSIWYMNGTLVSSISGMGVVPTSWLIQAAGAE